VNPDHLFIGTQKDNVHDMLAKGRARRGDVSGERNAASKLTGAIVLEMRRLRREEHMSYSAIAKRFGVATMTAYRAVVGDSWGTISEGDA
jgi:DNA invertase Pin-like site-specific DNA recombinase